MILEMIKINIVILFLLSGSFLSAQDPREQSHSMSIVPFEDSGNRYYITWASSSGSVDFEWQHDIYFQIIFFDDQGNLQSESGSQHNIGTGSDEAQEPVSVALNPNGNILLSVWEDGSGSTVDIRGQLHQPDGSVVKENWIIAGGIESQHSPVVAHLQNRFIVAFTDEALPALTSMNEVRIINDQNGEHINSIDLSPFGEDHWWSIIASNNRRHAFVSWGNGDDFFGSIVTVDSINVSATPQKIYASGIAQYYYSVSWLEEISRFISIIKSGNNGIVLLIDTTGVRTNFISIPNAAIAREAGIAVIWNNTEQLFKVIYPSHTRNVVILNVSESEIKLDKIVNGNENDSLKDITWPTTGIASQFVKSENGDDLWLSDKMVLFAYNDPSSNDAIIFTVNLDTETAISDKNKNVIPEQVLLYQNYPNPFNPATTIAYKLNNSSFVKLEVFNILGEKVKTLINKNQSPGFYKVKWNADNQNGTAIPSAVYMVKLTNSIESKTRRMVLIR